MSGINAPSDALLRLVAVVLGEDVEPGDRAPEHKAGGEVNERKARVPGQDRGSGRAGQAANGRPKAGKRASVHKAADETAAMLARMRGVLVREAEKLDSPDLEGKAAVDLVQQIARTLEKITELERAEAAASAARDGMELTAEDRARLRAELDALIRSAAEALVAAGAADDGEPAVVASEPAVLEGIGVPQDERAGPEPPG